MAGSAEKNPALHVNHRKRLRERFEKEGLSSFADHNVLELLLFYVLPRCDTNEVAHLLIEEFGSLSGVFNASPEALAGVPGIGAEAALFLRLIPAVCARYLEDSRREHAEIRNSLDAVNQLMPYFMGTDRERLVCIMTAPGGRVIRRQLVDEGGADVVAANAEYIASLAVAGRAGGVVIGHSHPYGFAAPSQDDLDMTVRLSGMLAPLGIRLLEHVIFADCDYYLISRSKRLPAGTLYFDGFDE